MRYPTPDEMKAARSAAQHTQGEAATLIDHSTRAWEQWEGNVRKMRPAIFKLYLRLAGIQHPDWQ